MDKTGWRRFLRLLAEVRSERTLEELSRLFFTPEEREDLSKRMRIVEELLKGEETQREIAKKYKVSIAKITRGSNALKEVSEEMKRLIQDV